MVEIGVKAGAALSRIAARLAPLVTNGIIEEVARHFRVARLSGSNKADKLHGLLAVLLSDGRATRAPSTAIATLVMEAHHRTVTGSAAMTWEDADAIVAEIRVLGLDPADLANTGWRKGLKRQTPETKPKAAAAPVVLSSEVRHASRPREYPEALDNIRKLLVDGTNPQWRGRELERLVLEVLVAEKLSPEHDLRNPGEQIDHAFVLDAHDYLVECKWEHDLN